MKKGKAIKKFFFLLLLMSAPCFSGELSKADALVGRWAMSPLKNGIANVAEFNKDGTAKLYSFRCDWTRDSFTHEETIEQTYDLEGDHITVYTGKEKTIETELVLKSVSESEMTLFQKIPDTLSGSGGLTFHYKKVKEAKPLCKKEMWVKK